MHGSEEESVIVMERGMGMGMGTEMGNDLVKALLTVVLMKQSL